MALTAPWRQRLDLLGLTAEEKGRAITLVMRMPVADRETQVDMDVEVAKASVRELLLSAGKSKLRCMRASATFAHALLDCVFSPLPSLSFI